jgi:hypothetical protein
MKKTVRRIAVLILVIALATFTAASSLASSYTSQADSLKELGLFQGTNNGYALDRAPTRAEAAVSLIRLLGKEAEVKAGTYDMPFTDVPDWAANYVGYMFENGLTKGKTSTTFGSNDACDAKMFTTFVLRSLCYTEADGDFVYDKAIDFSFEIGLSAGTGSVGTFLRDDMVALAYSALFQEMNDGSGNTLLEKLVADGAVSASTAAKYFDKYDTYAAFMDLMSKQDFEKIHMRTTTAQDMLFSGTSMKTNQQNDITIVSKGSDVTYKQVSTSDAAGKPTTTTTYYTDGWLYMDTADGKMKMEMPMDLASIISQTGLTTLISPFYLIQNIVKTETNDGVEYKLSLAPTMSAGASQMPQSSDMTTTSDSTTEATVKFSAAGVLTSYSVVTTTETTTTMSGQTSSFSMSTKMTGEILEYGDVVKVVLPADLDDYEELKMPVMPTAPAQ